jgi:hypothetical protein
MSRQTFVSNSFFVHASEETTRFILLSLPQKTNDIQFVSENNKINVTRFTFQPQDQENYQVDISLLPMNNEYTQVNLHIGYIDGHTFSHKSNIKQALVQFEYSIQAAIRGDISFFQPKVVEEKNSMSLLPALELIAGFISNLFLWKKV